MKFSDHQYFSVCSVSLFLTIVNGNNISSHAAEQCPENSQLAPSDCIRYCDCKEFIQSGICGVSCFFKPRCMCDRGFVHADFVTGNLTCVEQSRCIEAEVELREQFITQALVSFSDETSYSSSATSNLQFPSQLGVNVLHQCHPWVKECRQCSNLQADCLKGVPSYMNKQACEQNTACSLGLHLGRADEDSLWTTPNQPAPSQVLASGSSAHAWDTTRRHSPLWHCSNVAGVCSTCFGRDCVGITWASQEDCQTQMECSATGSRRKASNPTTAGHSIVFQCGISVEGVCDLCSFGDETCDESLATYLSMQDCESESRGGCQAGSVESRENEIPLYTEDHRRNSAEEFTSEIAISSQSQTLDLDSSEPSNSYEETQLDNEPRTEIHQDLENYETTNDRNSISHHFVSSQSPDSTSSALSSTSFEQAAEVAQDTELDGTTRSSNNRGRGLVVCGNNELLYTETCARSCTCEEHAELGYCEEICADEPVCLCQIGFVYASAVNRTCVPLASCQAREKKTDMLGPLSPRGACWLCDEGSCRGTFGRGCEKLPSRGKLFKSLLMCIRECEEQQTGCSANEELYVEKCGPFCECEEILKTGKCARLCASKPTCMCSQGHVYETGTRRCIPAEMCARSQETAILAPGDTCWMCNGGQFATCLPVLGDACHSRAANIYPTVPECQKHCQKPQNEIQCNSKQDLYLSGCGPYCVCEDMKLGDSCSALCTESPKCLCKEGYVYVPEDDECIPEAICFGVEIVDNGSSESSSTVHTTSLRKQNAHLAENLRRIIDLGKFSSSSNETTTSTSEPTTPADQPSALMWWYCNGYECLECEEGLNGINCPQESKLMTNRDDCQRLCPVHAILETSVFFPSSSQALTTPAVELSGVDKPLLNRNSELWYCKQSQCFSCIYNTDCPTETALVLLREQCETHCFPQFDGVEFPSENVDSNLGSEHSRFPTSLMTTVSPVRNLWFCTEEECVNCGEYDDCPASTRLFISERACATQCPPKNTPINVSEENASCWKCENNTCLPVAFPVCRIAASFQSLYSSQDSCHKICGQSVIRKHSPTEESRLIYTSDASPVAAASTDFSRGTSVVQEGTSEETLCYVCRENGECDTLTEPVCGTLASIDASRVFMLKPQCLQSCSVSSEEAETNSQENKPALHKTEVNKNDKKCFGCNKGRCTALHGSNCVIPPSRFDGHMYLTLQRCVRRCRNDSYSTENDAVDIEDIPVSNAGIYANAIVRNKPSSTVRTSVTVQLAWFCSQTACHQCSVDEDCPQDRRLYETLNACSLSCRYQTMCWSCNPHVECKRVTGNICKPPLNETMHTHPSLSACLLQCGIGPNPTHAPPAKQTQPEYSCRRQPIRLTCADGKPSQYTVRWYLSGDHCVAYPHGYCRGDRVLDFKAIRTRDLCEQLCLDDNTFRKLSRGVWWRR